MIGLLYAALDLEWKAFQPIRYCGMAENIKDQGECVTITYLSELNYYKGIQNASYYLISAQLIACKKSSLQCLKVARILRVEAGFGKYDFDISDQSP